MGFKDFLKNRSGLRVDNRKTTSAATLTLRQSLWPLSLVTILFFLWGFAYGLLDTLNKHFQNTLHIDRGRSAGLQAAYFGAYPLASLGYANWILRHYGYKTVFIFGLALYGIGALCMWPAGLNQSFGGFCGATFVIGSGLGSLETAANPYLTVCGPPRYSEIRINFAQAFNAIGTVVGPVLGSYAFFTETADDVSALQRVQWVYLAIGVFVFCLAAVFFVSNIPEVTDEDMAFQVSTTHVEEQDRPFWKQYKLFHATLAQFTYTGAQVAIAGYFINYAVDTWPGTDSAKGAKLLAGAQGAFAVGRFLGSGLMKYTRARYIFLAYISCCVAFLAAAITQREQRGIENTNPQSYTVTIEVIDSGIGVPEDAAATLFNPFSRFADSATRRYQGTGLGLSICKSLAELMNGTIGFHANPDGPGSVFWMSTKMRRLDSAIAPQARRISIPAAPTPPFDATDLLKKLAPQKQVLLVEDNKVNQTIMLKLLASLGFQRVDAAWDGAEAVRMVKQKPLAYHVILMDINMPVMNGITATEHIRAMNLNVPIIALTGNALKGDAETYLAKGMNDYIAKPLYRQQLVDLLWKWCGS